MDENQQTPTVEQPAELSQNNPVTQTFPAREGEWSMSAAETAAREGMHAESEEAFMADYDFQMPQGYELDKAMADELKPILSKFKVGKVEAQSLVDLHVKALQNQQKQIQDAWLAQEKSWLETVGRDTELSNPQNQRIALQAVKVYATPELRTLLEETRLGSHPEMVRLFMKIGKSISEDSSVIGSTGNTQKLPRDETGSPMLSFNSMK